MHIFLGLSLGLIGQALASPVFYLYAYGEGINGLEVFNSGGNMNEAPDPWTIKLDWYEWADQHGIWYATRRDGGDWSDSCYYLPGESSASTETRFESYSQMPDDVRSTRFLLDGDRAFYEEGGKHLSQWFALPVKGKENLYTVEWGSGDIDGKIEITMSKKPPHGKGA